MHEHALINDLFRTLDAVALAQRSNKIRSVSIWMGALCHISPEHFREHFEHQSLNTVAEGAVLQLTISEDIRDKNAQQILLTSVDLDVDERDEAPQPAPDTPPALADSPAVVPPFPAHGSAP